VVHNGIIENYAEIRAEQERLGYEFDSDTDTEVIATRIHHYLAEGANLVDAVRSATGKRLRPIAMTAAAVIAGLLPIMTGGGTGSDVMQRIAAPMLGGMVTTTVLSLLVLPLIYGIVLQIQGRLRARA